MDEKEKTRIKYIKPESLRLNSILSHAACGEGSSPAAGSDCTNGALASGDCIAGELAG
jgi:hypothetical protein